jgi:predicted neuraminidase
MSFLERGDKENDSIFRLHEQGNCENWSRLRLRRWWGVMQPVLDVQRTICIAFAFLADCPMMITIRCCNIPGKTCQLFVSFFSLLIWQKNMFFFKRP